MVSEKSHQRFEKINTKFWTSEKCSQSQESEMKRNETSLKQRYTNRESEERGLLELANVSSF